MNDLDEIYKHLARDWPSEELAARYASGRDHGARAIKNPRPAVARALPMVASALPPAATLDVAVYVLHMLSTTTRGDLARRLVDNAQQSSSAALHRCHRALELDGAAHSYTTDEWLPVVCNRTAELLKSSRLNEEPPTMVREAQDAISWLSRTLIELDQDSAETANALIEVLARLLAVSVFAETARDLERSV
jgi:flagellar biosynthesis regulator FlaF